MTILGLLIDDGVPDRGHRKTIFNPIYQYIGCKSEVQGEKIITVFNITENKLSLKSETNSNSLPSDNFGAKSYSNAFKSPPKSPRISLDDDRFYQTDFNLKKQTV